MVIAFNKTMYAMESLIAEMERMKKRKTAMVNISNMLTNLKVAL